MGGWSSAAPNQRENTARGVCPPPFSHATATEIGVVCGATQRKLESLKMRERKTCGVFAWRGILFALIVLSTASAVLGRPSKSSSAVTKKTGRQDDSLSSKPAADLALRSEGAHKADALTHFVEGMSFEENGEMDRALDAYRKVLNVDPGQSQLASRVAALLIQDDDFPQAIDV